MSSVAAPAQKYFWFIVMLCTLLPLSMFVVHETRSHELDDYQLTAAMGVAATSSPSVTETVAYHGTIYHVFFHSLIIYPELAYKKNDAKTALYKEYMITQGQFKAILESLYANQFVLIDIDSIYGVDSTGAVTQKTLYLPKGKKPLIISLDDLNYYTFMQGRGFAHKLVLDTDGRVATAVTTPQGVEQITRDGDIVPILDDFVLKHPDFSVGGAKGVIALTGFQGIMGYRTQASNTVNRPGEIAAAKKVVDALKQTGWRFASHSYTHGSTFQTDTISLQELASDTAQWKAEVGTLVGPTDIFVGPFGQVFKENDPRRKYLVSAGYKMFCGVGLDLYLRYFGDHVVMDRADIDNYRITHNAKGVDPYFSPNSVLNL